MITWNHIFHLFRRLILDDGLVDFRPFRDNTICVFTKELEEIEKCLLVEYISETELNIKMVDISVFRKELGLE